MASNHIVWGIDIGNTSLKALRCTAGSEPGTMQVHGFDYIEHSKVLSQPGADAAQIMAETIAQFLSRNDIAGEKVAISVSGQKTAYLRRKSMIVWWRKDCVFSLRGFPWKAGWENNMNPSFILH